MKGDWVDLAILNELTERCGCRSGISSSMERNSDLKVYCHGGLFSEI